MAHISILLSPSFISILSVINSEFANLFQLDMRDFSFITKIISVRFRFWDQRTDCSNYIFHMLTNCTHTVDYLYIYYYYYLSDISCMFWHILYHPQGELLSLAQNCLLIVMLLHQLQSIKYITCWFYNVIYNYQNNIWLFVVP